MSLKTFRKTIRINGEEIKSPRFRTKSDADRWYSSKLSEKQYQASGLHAPIDKDTTLNAYFHSTWYPLRKLKYPPSTYLSDFQRYSKYVDPPLGKLKVSKINQLQIRTVLRNVVDVSGLSVETRNRVRALLSKIFNDAMNEERPLRSDNPAYGITFNDPRKGKKKPNYIASEKDILSFIKHAKSLGRAHFLYACIVLMTGVRKSELIALTWGDLDEDNSEFSLNKRFMQAANKIVAGLKSGSEDSHPVAFPDELMKVLRAARRKTEFNADDDFVLCRDDGKNFGPREVSRLNEAIREASGVRATTHGLRHTYGRQFVLNGGSMKALQAILGHSSSSTTELYSQLAGKTVNKFRNTVSYETEGENDPE